MRWNLKDGDIRETKMLKFTFQIQLNHKFSLTMMKPLVLVAVATAFMAWPRANAATPATATADANADSNPAATMPASLGDPVIVKGNGFEIRRSAMDQVLATARANNPQDELPADADVHVINQLIEMQLVLQKATDAEKAAGKQEADERLSRISKSLGATEFARRLKATQMTVDDLRLAIFQEDTAQPSWTRQLGIQVTDADAQKWFDDHPGAYDQPEAACVRELLLL